MAVRFALASYGTRGDVEPSIVVGCELKRRGHDVRIAVPPDLVPFAESAGLIAVPYGAETQAWMEAFRKFSSSLFSTSFRPRDQWKWGQEIWEVTKQSWMDMNETAKSLAHGSDLVVAGQTYQEIAANVAEYQRLPLVTLHHVPMRPNGQVVAALPAPVSRLGVKGFDWLTWRLSKKVEDSQRCELGLPKATSSSPRRIGKWRTLEIQAYDAAVFPGLADEWAQWKQQRPFVGALTMEFPTSADEEVASWTAAGTSPIFFGFGSMPVESPVETMKMISSACAALGVRALICAGWSDFDEVPLSDHVKVVQAVNYTSILPRCRAAVHHGGSGTTAASLRAGIPTLILSMDGNQMIWGAQVNRRLKVGTHRRFSNTTTKTLVRDLRRILAPEYSFRARALASKMTKPAESVTRAGDFAENFARAQGRP